METAPIVIVYCLRFFVSGVVLGILSFLMQNRVEIGEMTPIQKTMTSNFFFDLF